MILKFSEKCAEKTKEHPPSSRCVSPIFEASSDGVFQKEKKMTRREYAIRL